MNNDLSLKLKKMFTDLSEKQKWLLVDLADYNAYFKQDSKTNKFSVDAMLEKADQCFLGCDYDKCVGVRYSCYIKSSLRKQIEEQRGIFDYCGFNFKKARDMYNVCFYNKLDYEDIIQYLKLAKEYYDQMYPVDSLENMYDFAGLKMKFIIAPDIFGEPCKFVDKS